MSLQAADSSIKTNEWYHVAFTRKGNTWSVYRDGELRGAQELPGVESPRFTSGIVFGSVNGNVLNGWIDELRITKGIARYVNSSNAVPAGPFQKDQHTSLLLHFDGPGGSPDIRDESLSKTIILTNMPGDDGTHLKVSGGMMDGVAASFEGFCHGPVKPYLFLTNADLPPGLQNGGKESSLSVAVWIKLPDLGKVNSTDAVLAMRDGFGLAVGNPSNSSNECTPKPGAVTVTAYFKGFSAGSFHEVKSAAGAIRSDTWHHLVAVCDSDQNNIRLYVDGVQHGSGVQHDDGVDLQNDLFVGTNGGLPGGADHLFGSISDLAIWNRVLSDAEIRALATGLPVQDAGIVSYWPMDEETGQRRDAIGSNDLTPANGVTVTGGRVGDAVQLAKAGQQYLSISNADQTGLNITNGLTAMAWVRPNDTSASTFLEKFDTVGGYSLGSGAVPTDYFIEISGEATRGLELKTPGKWQHITGVFDGTTRSIWVDGALERRTNQERSRLTAATNEFHLGRYYSESNRYWDGLLDEVIVAKRALREEEIKALYIRGLNKMAAIDVPIPPAITTQPRGQTNHEGNNLILGVGVTGSPLNYQWQFNGTNLAGQTNALLFLPRPTPSDSGRYTVVVTNQLGSVTSAEANVMVKPLPANRTVVGWGKNDSGQTDVPTAAQTGVVAIAARAGHSVALKADGTVVAWGSNAFGQRNVPPGLNGVVAIAAGNTHIVALKGDGSVIAWGSNGEGQTNVPPAAQSRVVAVTAGGRHALALKNDGTVVAWGKNDFGQTTVPAGLKGVVAIAAGSSHSMALKKDGTVVTWGLNNHLQTNGPTSLVDAVAIAAVDDQSLALKSDGTVEAWGKEFFDTTFRPVSGLEGLTNAVAVAAGVQHRLALRSDGEVAAGGHNDFGQLNIPVGLSGALAVAAGGHHSLALMSGPPAIRTRLESLVVISGASPSFTVDAFGPGPLSYQWRLNGTDIPGATSRALSIANATAVNAGRYDVVVSNAEGNVTSQAARLTVFDAAPKEWVGTVGGGDGQSWGDPNNWSGGSRPGDTDDILIPAGSETIIGPGGNLTVKNLLCLRSLAFTGSLTVKGGVDILGGLLLGPGSSITAAGTNAWLTAEGTATADGVTMTAEDGGAIRLLGLESYQVAQAGVPALEAKGDGSVLDLPRLRQIKGPGSDNKYLTIRAGGGGRINLEGVTNIIGSFNSETGFPRGTWLSATGGGSRIDLARLEQFLDSERAGASSLTVSDGGVIFVPALREAVGLSLIVGPGRRLELPELRSYRSGYWNAPTLSASGAMAVLALPKLGRIEGPQKSEPDIQGPQYLQITAAGGGKINLGGVTNIIGSFSWAGILHGTLLSATGEDSRIDLARLEQFLDSERAGASRMTVSDGGMISAPSLRTAVGLSLIVDPGQRLELPELRSYRSGVWNAPTLSASGAMAVLDLPKLAKIEGPQKSEPAERDIQGPQYLRITAAGGGKINLSGVTNIVGSSNISGTALRGTHASADGQDSLIVLTNLLSFSDAPSVGNSKLVQTNGGRILLNLVTYVGPVPPILAPALIAQPQGRDALVGSEVRFTVEADGSPLLTYQWKRNQVDIVGATSPVFVLPNVTTHHAGSYSVAITNQYGSASSAQAVLRVAKPLAVLSLGRGSVLVEPSPTNYTLGSVFTLTATNQRHYRFDGWSDGTNTSARTVAINVTNNTYTAKFVPSVALETNLVRVWEHSFGGNNNEQLTAASLTHDGSILLGGDSDSPPLADGIPGAKEAPVFGSNDYWIVKLSADGLLQWQKSYGGPDVDSLQDIVVTHEGGFLLAGHSSSGIGGTKTTPNRGEADGWLVRIDDFGREIWQTRAGGTGNDELITMVQAENGGFVGGGSAAPPGANGIGSDLWLFSIGIDGSGETRWNLSSNPGYENIAKVLRTPEGYLAIGAAQISGSWNKWAGQFDSRGGSIWSWSDNKGGAIILNDASIRSDGLCVIGGYTEVDNRDWWLGRITDKHEIAGNFQEGGAADGDDRMHSLAWLADGTLLAGGDLIKTSGGSDCWLLKFRDQDGSLVKVWDYAWGGDGEETISVVLETPDGGYVLAGTSSSPGVTGPVELWARPGDASLPGAGVAPFGTKQSTSHGGTDWWVLKIAEVHQPVGTPMIFVNGLYSLSNRHEFLTTNEVEVAMTSSPSLGATEIYYTLGDGRAPTTSSVRYTNSFRVRPQTIVRAAAYPPDRPRILSDPVQINSVRSYTLTATNLGGGPVELSIQATAYPSNQVVGLAAPAVPGWTFLRWVGDAAGTNDTLALVMDTNKFVQALYGTSLNASASGGPDDGEVELEPPGPVFPYGTVVRLSPIPQPSRYFDTWARRPGDASGFAPLSYVVREPEPVFRADFGELLPGEHSLTVRVQGAGSVTRDPQSGYFGNGAEVTLTSLPDTSHWTFAGWSGDATGTNNPLPVKMDASKVITAHFRRTDELAAPRIAAEPTNQSRKVGQSVEFSVIASGTPAPSYQWWYDGAPVEGATGATLQLADLEPRDAGDYHVDVANAAGSVTSRNARLTVTTNQLPVARMEAPESPVTLPASIVLEAVATDADGEVNRVDFFANGSTIGSSTKRLTGDRFQFTSNPTSPGPMQITAQATDNDGAKGAVSPPKGVTLISIDPRPSFRLEILTPEVSEAVPGATITNKIRKTGTGPGVVRFRLTNEGVEGARAEPVRGRIGDYLEPDDINSRVTFLAIDSVKEFTITLVNDRLEEPSERFRVVLEPLDDSVVIEPRLNNNDTIISLLDDDAGAFSQSTPNHVRNPIELPGRGGVTVNIFGTNESQAPVNAGWRFPWETSWRSNRATVGNLPKGEYPIAWRPAAGQSQPLDQVVLIQANKTNSKSFSYRAGITNLGRLQVTTTPRSGTGWHFAGEGGSQGRTSGTVEHVPPGVHLVHFADLDGYATPAPIAVTVPLVGEGKAEGRYEPVKPVTAFESFPAPVGGIEVITNNLTARGHAFNGQVWTGFGWGSGFAVGGRVILTAAHLIYRSDGGTLRETPYLYWFPQRDRDTLAAQPLRAAGWFVHTNYTKFIGQTARFQWDFAAIYFDEDVVPHGWGGFLVSTPEGQYQLATPSGAVELTGYPMGGSRFGLNIHNHRMHRIERLLSGTSVFDGPGSFELARTLKLRSIPGNSGGPVYVQPQGAFLPAGIYLGEDDDEFSLVRTIDRDVVEQIMLAATAAAAGKEHCFGGCPPVQISNGQADEMTLSIVIAPAGIFPEDAAVTVRTASDSARVTHQQFDAYLAVRIQHTIEFPTIPGYITPASLVFTPSPAATGMTTNVIYMRAPSLRLTASVNPMRVEISGVTNRTVVLQRTDHLGGVWLDYQDVTVGGSGHATVEVPQGETMTFFRAILP